MIGVMKGSDKLWSGVLILIFILEILSAYNHWDYILSIYKIWGIVALIAFFQFIIFGIIFLSLGHEYSTFTDRFELYREESVAKQLFPIVFLWGAVIPIILIILLVIFIKKLNKWADDKL